MEIFIALLVFWIICGFVAERMGKEKGNDKAGCLLGFFFGPLGILMTMLMTDKRSEEAKRGVQKSKNYVAPKVDPMLEWEAREKAKTVLPVPEHLRGRKVDEE